MTWYTEIACTSVDQFIEAIDETRSGFGPSMMVYRGLGDSDFCLRPSLYRQSYGSISVEIQVILNFMLVAQRGGLVIPPDAMTFITLYNDRTRGKMTSLLHDFTDNHKNIYEYDVGNIAFAMARHAGIPTRHLDFTWDPLVAIYFAVSSALGIDVNDSKKLPKRIAVWAINYDDILKSFGVINHDWTHIPSLRNQQGLFIFDPTINIELLDCWTKAPSFEEPMSQIPFENENWKITLTCTVENVRKLVKHLTSRNFAKWTMFPTYENVRHAVMSIYDKPSPARSEQPQCDES